MSCNPCKKSCGRVTPGIMTFGLGGNATNLIAGTFSLFGACVKIIVKPDTGGGSEPYTPPYSDYTHPETPSEVIIIVTRNGKEWRVTHKTKNPEVIIKLVSVTSNKYEQLRVAYIKTKNETKKSIDSAIQTIDDVSKKIVTSVRSATIKLKPLIDIKYIKTKLFVRDE